MKEKNRFRALLLSELERQPWQSARELSGALYYSLSYTDYTLNRMWREGAVVIKLMDGGDRLYAKAP